MEQPELVMKFLTVLGAPLTYEVDCVRGLAWIYLAVWLPLLSVLSETS